MNKFRLVMVFSALVAGISITGCEPPNVHGSVGVSYHSGPGWYDPWYYNHYHGGNIIVRPPPRPPVHRPPRPEHPIARPPVNRPMPRPPSRPRPMPRR